MRTIFRFIAKELKTVNKKRTFSLLGFLFILAFFPVIFANSNKSQETRTQAAIQANQLTTTSLSFYPPSSFSNPIQGSVGQPLSIDLMLSPGNDKVTTLVVHIVFPKKTFTIAGAKFVVNQAIFPNIDKPPVVTEGGNGDINFTVSNPAGITYEAKVGTLTLVPQAVVTQANQQEGVVGFLPPTNAVQESQAYIFVSQGSPVPTNVLTTPGGSPPSASGGAVGSPSGTKTPAMDASEAYSPQPSIWLFLIPIAITFFTILFY
jgi:hypothetical protein